MSGAPTPMPPHCSALLAVSFLARRPALQFGASLGFLLFLLHDLTRAYRYVRYVRRLSAVASVSSANLLIFTFHSIVMTNTRRIAAAAAAGAVPLLLVAAISVRTASAFQTRQLTAHSSSVRTASAFQTRQLTAHSSSSTSSLANASDGGPSRRTVLGAGLFGGIFGSGGNGAAATAAAAVPSPPSGGGSYKPKGPTNEVVKVVNGMKRRRLGGSDIVVSELGLGTQRWVSLDHNAPDEKLCFDFMDEAILKSGVNLLDTAEQYPIPSGGGCPEGSTEECIGKWLRERKGSVKREDVVIATKITGGRNVNPRNIKKDCEGSLKRLGTDYIDVYQLHWPQRYSPQSNWGQSLQYQVENDASPYWRNGGGPTSFEDLCISMEGLIQEGKIRGWGLCNDNAYGLTACTRTAKFLGTTPPVNLQGDFSIIDRKVRLVETSVALTYYYIVC